MDRGAAPADPTTKPTLPLRPGESGPRAPLIILGLALLLYAGLTLYTAVVTLQRFPNAGDEYAYLISAQLFTTGRLSAPSPSHSRFFNFNHILNNGQFYGKYPPGWPLLLTVGIVAHAPWTLNPVFGLLTLVLLWKLTRRHFSDLAASYVVMTLAVNPFFVLNSASHFSHSSCLFFMTLCAYGVLNWRDHPESWQDALWAGLGAAMAFLIRPFSAVLILTPLGIAMLQTGALQLKNRRILVGLASAVLILGTAVFFYCLYNYRLTGSPFHQPFTQYDPSDHPRLPTGPGQWWEWFKPYSGARLLDINWPWLPFTLVFLAVFWGCPSLRSNAKARLLFISCLMLSIGYSFYPGDGGIGYGPRYNFETLVGIVPIIGLVYARFSRIAPYLIAVTLAVNCSVFVTYSRMIAGVIREKKGVYEAVRRDHLENAIVFLRAGTGVSHPGDLTRNGLQFDGSVLYVLDLGSDNARLRRAHPSRKSYLYVLNAGEEPGPLEALPELR